MNRLIIKSLAAVLFVATTLFTQAADEKPAATPSGEVRQLVRKIESKLQQGKDKESDLADELKEFDALIERHRAKAPDAAAEAAYMKALLYVQVWDNSQKGAELMRVVQKDFPKTTHGASAAQFVASYEKQAAMDEKLKVGKKFPEFSEKDINGKPFSLANLKGKIVLIDFWATWCGPCRAELPNVLEAYEKYHDKGFEILGISLDKDRDALVKFTESKKMTWQQYFDGKGWENKLAQQFGISGIPATFLVDGEGTIIARDLRGDDLSTAVAKALAKK